MNLRVKDIVIGAVATGTHDLVLNGPIKSNQYKGHAESIVHIEIEGAATVRVLGRLHPDMAFVEVIPPTTVSLIQPVVWLPELRVDITAWSSGAVNARILIP